MKTKSRLLPLLFECSFPLCFTIVVGRRAYQTTYRPSEIGKTVSGFYGFDFEGGVAWSSARDRRHVDSDPILVPSSRGRRTTTGDALIVALPRYNVSRMFLSLKRVCSWSIWKLSGYLCARWIFIDVPYRRCDNIGRDRWVFGRVNRERKVEKKKKKIETLRQTILPSCCRESKRVCVTFMSRIEGEGWRCIIVVLQTPSKRRKKIRELRKRRSSVLERDIINSTSFAILRRIFRIHKHAESSRQRGALGDRVAACRGPLSLSTRYFYFLIENNRSRL